MTEKREYVEFLQDIYDNLQSAASFVEGMTFDSFASNQMARYAVFQALEIVGEAVKNVPSSVKDRYPNIPWKEMAGLRDKLVHGYFGVDLDTVWKTSTERVPALLPLIKAVLRAEEGRERR